MGLPLIDLDQHIDAPTSRPPRAAVGRWVAGALVIVLAGIVGLLLAAGSPPDASLDAQARLGEGGVTAFGTLNLDISHGVGPEDNDETVARSDLWSYSTDSGTCVGVGPFADVRAGAAITISADGVLLSTGQLNGGRPFFGSCTFSWAAVHVPTGLDRYTIAMAGHGSVDVIERALATQIPLTITAPPGTLELPSPRPVPQPIPQPSAT